MAIQIVYARAEKTKLVPTGRTVTRDLNYFPEMVATWEGRAGMWLHKGTESDLARARAFAAAEGYTIFTFPPDQKNCLEMARNMVVKNAKD